MDPCHMIEKQENNTSKLPKLCLFLLQTILKSSTLTLFISSLHLISVIPFVSYALKKTITAARELILAQKNKTFVVWQQLRSPLVLRGHSLLVIPCHPGNPAMINSRLRFLFTLIGHRYSYSLLQFQYKPLGLVVQVHHRGLSLQSCPVIETNKSI